MSKFIDFNDRPLQNRLQVAYMAMAAFPSKFTKCEPGEAHDRLFNEVFGNNDHPYTVMWRAVEWFYTHQGWQHLANYEITDKFAVAFRNGFQYRNTSKTMLRKADAKSVQNAVKSWDTWGWKRYEHLLQEDKKSLLGNVKLAAPVILLATLFL